MTKQAIQHTSTQKASEEDERKRGEEKANLFKNSFRSGGEENERKKENNVNARGEFAIVTWISFTLNTPRQRRHKLAR